MGFEKGSGNVYHRIFKEKLDNYALTNPVFATNGALYLRRLFAKGAQIVLMLRPCEIRSYIELAKLTQIEPADIIAVSVDCFGTVSSKKEGDVPAGEELKGLTKDADRARWACANCRERRASSVTRAYASMRTGPTGPSPTRTRARHSSPLSTARPRRRRSRWRWAPVR
jgi:hypothetical protein